LITAQCAFVLHHQRAWQRHCRLSIIQ